MKKLLIILAASTALLSCKKEYDTPPLTYPAEGTAVTIDSLRQMYQANGPMSISDNLDLYCVVTMDENDGNIYKSVYVQDGTSAINVRMANGGGVYKGDSVRISLRGCYLNQFSGVMQLDSVNADWNIVKQETDVAFAPEVTTIDQITTLKESQLVKLENVQFVQWQLNDTYADKPNLESGQILLEDVNGNTIPVETSGYASFADQQVAQGSGSIVCIVSHFNGELKLLIRSFIEINMSGARFDGLVLRKDFNDDDVNSGGWTTYDVIPSVAVWETSSAGGAPNPYCQISNFNGTSNEATEVWLISPSFDISTATSPTLAFDNAENYGGDPLEIWISTDYESGNPQSGNWTELTSFANWSAGSWAWVNSGNIDLSAYTGSNVHVAFKYTGTNSSGSTWEIDNIIIKG